MIPIVLAPEPPGFNSMIREKGLSSIDEMVGRPPRVPHRGRRRQKIAIHEEDIPAEQFPPYWRDALPDLLRSYKRRCAFLALYLEHATGNPSVDHMLPKSRRWNLVYEWENYRLCAASVNARRNDMTGIIDPVECRAGWFALELVGFQVIRGATAPPANARAIDATLDLVNTPEFCKAREEYVTSYEAGDISVGYLERRAPFVAGELRWHGRLRSEG